MIMLGPAALLVGLSVLLHGTSAAQSSVSTGDQVRVRLTSDLQAAWPSFWIRGTVTVARTDSLWMRVQRPAVTTGFAASDIARLEVHRG